MTDEVAVVTTTIGIPKSIPEIYDNAQKFGWNNVHFYVVGDNKTPIPEVNKFLEKTIPRESLDVLSMRDQKQWLRDVFGRRGDIYEGVFQENNYQRRIIGFLIAREEGAKTIIAVDDDNYPRNEESFVAGHIYALGKHDDVQSITSDNTYINFIDFLVETGVREAHVRGYPLQLFGDYHYECVRRSSDVIVNIGIWSGDPDIDALTRLAHGDTHVKYDPHRETTIVGRGCFTSMCLQNIAFNTNYLVTQYEFPMNVPMGGLTLGRYDDIWAGYVCKKILDYMKKDMVFGPPTAIHRRHPHDATKDFLDEFWGMVINTWFYPAIQTLQLEGSNDNCIDLFIQLVEELSHSLRFKMNAIQKYFNRVWVDMYNWAEMVEVIG